MSPLRRRSPRPWLVGFTAVVIALPPWAAHGPRTQAPLARRAPPRSAPMSIAPSPPSPKRVAVELRRIAESPGPEIAAARRINGEPMLGANDLARLLDATKFWRADVRKLALRTRMHRILLTADNPFVLIDDTTIRLPMAVRSLGGELQVSVRLIDRLPRDSTIARLLFDPSRDVVLQVPPAGIVGSPHWTTDGDETRVVFPVDRPEGVIVASRSRGHFRLHFDGLFVGAASETLARGNLVRAIRGLPTASGGAVELEIDARAQGFRVSSDVANQRVQVAVSEHAHPDFESFAPEAPPGPRPLHVVVLDPGHGGTDAGVAVGGVTEKDLTLGLARALKVEIERRLGARVVLTREDDRAVPADQRAERANRARADVVLSLHFDGFPSPGMRGATAYCPPAIYASESRRPSLGSAGPMPVLPWRDVATRHAVASRALAEDILSSLELRGEGPTRLRELLPATLLGVNAPGLMLECATLSSEPDRMRLLRPGGMNDLATAIVDGLDAYHRNE